MENINNQFSKSFLSSKDIIRRARKFYKENFKKLWPLYILGGLGGMSFSGGSGGGSFSSSSSTSSASSPFLDTLLSIPWWVWVLVGILIIVVSIFLFISKISLLKGISDTHKGQFIGVKDSYRKGFGLFWSFILIGLIASWSILGATVLLVIPGIILSVYLSFAMYELIDKQKKGFSAFLGSWSLIKGYWWKLVGKSIMIGLRILLISLVFGLLILVPTLLLIIPGVILSNTVLFIAGVAVGIVGFFCVFVIFITPLSMIAMFELYYNFCDVRESNKVIDEALDKKRKRKIKISMIIGIVASILIILAILAAVILLNTAQINQAKNSVGEYSPISIVGEMKKDIVFPYIIDETIKLNDITAEPSAIRYHYVVSGDMSGMTNDSIKQLTVSSICTQAEMRDLLEHDINFESSYITEVTQQTFFVIISKADCQ